MGKYINNQIFFYSRLGSEVEEVGEVEEGRRGGVGGAVRWRGNLLPTARTSHSAGSSN